MFRPGILLLTAVMAAGLTGLAAAPPSPPASISRRYEEVTVEPARTSIYIASVSLVLHPFTRHDGVYTTDYAAKVIPFIFFNERGTISIDFSDAQLQQIERGETVDFKGRGSNSGGAIRRVEGRVVPDAPGGSHGRIKVRVWVTKKIELIFNTAYRLTGKE